LTEEMVLVKKWWFNSNRLGLTELFWRIERIEKTLNLSPEEVIEFRKNLIMKEESK